MCHTVLRSFKYFVSFYLYYRCGWILAFSFFKSRKRRRWGGLTVATPQAMWLDSNSYQESEFFPLLEYGLPWWPALTMLEIDKMLVSSASKSHCLLLLSVFELCPDALATSLDGPFRWWEIQCSLTTLVRIRASRPPGRWAIPFLEHPVPASNQLTTDPCSSPKRAAVPGPDWQDHSQIPEQQ